MLHVRIEATLSQGHLHYSLTAHTQISSGHCSLSTSCIAACLYFRCRYTVLDTLWDLIPFDLCNHSASATAVAICNLMTLGCEHTVSCLYKHHFFNVLLLRCLTAIIKPKPDLFVWPQMLAAEKLRVSHPDQLG